jgi:hypothetical protein
MWMRTGSDGQQIHLIVDKLSNNEIVMRFPSAPDFNKIKFTNIYSDKCD